MNLKSLIEWSQREFRDLPWRQNRTLYSTLVSEIMLQQTTVGTVKNHYEKFLQRFPNLKSLALASEAELLVAWKGLGYYRRARNLKKIAEALFKDHQGQFPRDMESLQEISGIGPYTANALIAIGMDEKALAVDANLERVIARLYGLKEEKGPRLQKHVQQMFKEKRIFPERNLSFRALNEALMDLGRTYCQARKASCDLCPLKADCVARTEKRVLSYPIDKKAESKLKEEYEIHLLRVYVMKKDKVLVYRKEDHEWLAGQYEVPTFILETNDKKLKQYPVFKGRIPQKNLQNFKTGITKYKIKNFLYESDEKSLKKFKVVAKLEWREIENPNSNLSTATSKGYEKLRKNRDQE